MSPTMTTPGRADRTCEDPRCGFLGSSLPAALARRAPTAGVRPGWPSAERAAPGAQCIRAGGGGEQWTTCQSVFESPTLPPRECGPEEGGGDTGDTVPRDLEGPTSCGVPEGTR